MGHDLLLGLASIFVIGIAAQIISYKLKFPSILLLITFGFIAGPILGFLDPDLLLGDLLFPVVSLSVAVILFEGGLSLRFKDIPGLRTLIINLITVGVVITWILLAIASYYVLGLSFQVSILLGAILTVSGPTVIIPLLNHVRPKAPLGPVLKWEGILIDPVGAILAVLVFEAFFHNYTADNEDIIIAGMLYTLLIGFSIGTVAAFTLKKVIKNYLIPDNLQNPFALALVFLVYVLSNQFQEESGLLSVTVMGVILANTTDVTVRHILEFKETLRVLLIAGLFIILAARTELDDLMAINYIHALGFIMFAILFVRPLCVFISAIGSGLNFKQKVFMSFVAPRGIVAAAVTSVFSLELIKKEVPGAELLLPYVFIFIFASVIFYGLAATPIARLLHLTDQDSSGVFFIGSNQVAIEIAKELRKHNIKTLLLDTNPRNVYLAIKEDLEAIHGDFVYSSDERHLDLAGLGTLIAVTPNNEANSLATLHFSEEFGRSHVFQLPPADNDNQEIINSEKHLHGRFVFSPDANYYHLEDMISAGAKVVSIEIDDDEGYQNLLDKYEEKIIPMFVIPPNVKRLDVLTLNSDIKPKADSTIIALLDQNS